MKLENEYLRVEIAEAGAEVLRIYDKKKEREILWDGNPEYWKRRSPVLFPNVGKTFMNTVQISGTQYPTSQHGFARDMVFECMSESEDKAAFRLCSSEETKSVYPFEFVLTIVYTLKKTELTVCWNVENSSDETMYFTIGGHPAFRFPQKEACKDDYSLLFPGKNSLQYILIHPESGTANVETVYEMQLNQGRYPLSEKLFENDALILDDGQIEEAWICDSEGNPFVGMSCANFPNFGIWSVQGAPFVCLEPWMGRCDNRGFADDISEKPGINKLEGRKIFVQEYQIIVA